MDLSTSGNDSFDFDIVLGDLSGSSGNSSGKCSSSDCELDEVLKESKIRDYMLSLRNQHSKKENKNIIKLSEVDDSNTMDFGKQQLLMYSAFEKFQKQNPNCLLDLNQTLSREENEQQYYYRDEYYCRDEYQKTKNETKFDGQKKIFTLNKSENQTFLEQVKFSIYGDIGKSIEKNYSKEYYEAAENYALFNEIPNL